MIISFSMTENDKAQKYIYEKLICGGIWGQYESERYVVV